MAWGPGPTHIKLGVQAQGPTGPKGFQGNKYLRTKVRKGPKGSKIRNEIRAKGPKGSQGASNQI